MVREPTRCLQESTLIRMIHRLFYIGCFEPLVVKRTKKYEISRPTATCCWLLFLRGGMGDVTKGKRLFAGFRKSSSEVQKVPARYAGVRCIVFPRKRGGECRWMLTGGGRSDDISCQIEDVSCRRPRKSWESWYTKSVNL